MVSKMIMNDGVARIRNGKMIMNGGTGGIGLREETVVAYLRSYTYLHRSDLWILRGQLTTQNR
jgi:hypothetical protein